MDCDVNGDGSVNVNDLQKLTLELNDCLAGIEKPCIGTGEVKPICDGEIFYNESMTNCGLIKSEKVDCSAMTWANYTCYVNEEYSISGCKPCGGKVCNASWGVYASNSCYSNDSVLDEIPACSG